MSEESTQETGNNPGDLRAQLDAALKENKALKSQPTRDEIAAEVRASVAREAAIGQALIQSNVPTSVAPLVLDKLGENEPTPEGVGQALADLGFATEQAPVETPASNALEEVSSLSGRVQAAADHGTAENFDKKLDAMEEEATDFRDLSNKIVAEGNDEWEAENKAIRDFKTKMAFPGL